ncbi:hypothetical protein ACLOJK_008420 [Asimina triloba]
MPIAALRLSSQSSRLSPTLTFASASLSSREFERGRDGCCFSAEYSSSNLWCLHPIMCLAGVQRLERFLREQGIPGQPYTPFSGNAKDFFRAKKESESKPMELSHRIVPRVLLFFDQMLKTRFSFPPYAQNFVSTVPKLVWTSLLTSEISVTDAILMFDLPMSGRQVSCHVDEVGMKAVTEMGLPGFIFFMLELDS